MIPNRPGLVVVRGALTEKMLAHIDRIRALCPIAFNLDRPHDKYHVYVHFRLSDGTPFYAGKGSDGDKTYKRAVSTGNRNKHWHHTVDKHDFVSVIAGHFGTDPEALGYEPALIKLLREAGYPMTNLTDGGEGAVGYVPTEETKKLISDRTAEAMARPGVKQRVSEALARPDVKAKLQKKIYCPELDTTFPSQNNAASFLYLLDNRYKNEGSPGIAISFYLTGRRTKPISGYTFAYA
jgi:hypothetical protein